MHIFLAIVAAGIVLYSLREGLDEWREPGVPSSFFRALVGVLATISGIRLLCWIMSSPGRFILTIVIIDAVICVVQLRGWG
jgi:hypothetical protein